MSPKELSDIASLTNFNESEIHDWYKGFMKVSKLMHTLLACILTGCEFPKSTVLQHLR